MSQNHPQNRDHRLEHPMKKHAIDLLHIMTLCGFALAQPLYDVLGHQPEFFLIRRSHSIHIIMLLITLSILVPLPVLLLHCLTILAGERVRQIAYITFVFLFTVLIFIPLFNRNVNWSAWSSIGAVLLIGAGTSYAVIRRQWLRTFLTILSPAILIFPLLFLINTPVYNLTRSMESTVNIISKGREDVPSVILVIFDELPLLSLMNTQGDIDSIRYPHFARLASESTWYRDTTTVARLTDHAVPAILTGRYPEGTGAELADFSRMPENLFTLLAGEYKIHSFEIVTRLCPHIYCDDTIAQQQSASPVSELLIDVSIVYLNIITPPDLKRRFNWMEAELHTMYVRSDMRLQNTDTAMEAFMLKYGGDLMSGTTRTPDWRIYQFESFLSSINSDNGQLYVLHNLMPHVPFRFTPSGRIYTDSPALPGWRPTHDRWDDQEEPIQLAYRRHLMQLRYTDKLLGRLLDRLKTQGTYDRALLIITADHGISFRAGEPRRTPTDRSFQEIVNVPLFIKYPHQKTGRLEERPVQTVDIVPTVADAIGITVPWDVDGDSLLNERFPAERIFERERFERYWSESEPALARQVRLYGDGAEALTDVGPHADLYGLTLTGIRNQIDFTCGVGLERQMDPQESTAYARAAVLVQGLVQCETNRNSGTVVITVDGIVRSSASLYRDENNIIRFGTLLPEAVIQNAHPNIEVYVLK